MAHDNVPKVPLWAVIVVTLSLIASAGSTVASAFSSKNAIQHDVIFEKIKSTESVVTREVTVNDEQEKRIVDLEKVVERVVANQNMVIKIIDRMERNK